MKQFLRNEASILKAVEHPNIVKLLEFSEEEKYTTSDTYTRKVAYLALEVAEKGDLIKLISKFGKLPESAAKFYFSQLINTLEYIHSSGYCHLDIKPDNILLDKDYNLKLWDFGFSSDSKKQWIKKGTLNYAAPEIFSQEIYLGPQTDIFAAGIILFIMVTGHPPFCKPDVSDIRYKHLMNNNTERFWQLASKKNGKIQKYSDKFKDLINSMLSPYPICRPSLAEIKMHDWFSGDIMTHKDILWYFESNYKKI